MNMSNITETPLQIEVRAKSEAENPYAQTCPNRHLWSEGYRYGSSQNPIETRLRAKLVGVEKLISELEKESPFITDMAKPLFQSRYAPLLDKMELLKEILNG